MEIIQGNNITYIEPNQLSGDNIGIEQEKLTKYVNLSVRVPSRYYNKFSKTVFDSILNGSTFEEPDSYVNIPLLTTNYTDFSLDNIISGNTCNTEMFGIRSIKVNFDSQLFPRVDMTFTDVRGFGLLTSNEIVTNNPDFNAKTFFTSLFNFPYPIFTLTLKGYYGGTVSFNLSLLTFETEFESESGNFNVHVSFIGDMYGVLADIPMSYLLVAPFLGSNNNTLNSYWTSISDNNDLPTFIGFIERYGSFINGEFSGNFNEDALTGYIQDLNLLAYLEALKIHYDYINELSTKTYEWANSVSDIAKNEKGAFLLEKFSQGDVWICNGEDDFFTDMKFKLENLINNEVKKLKIPFKEDFNYAEYNDIDISETTTDNQYGKKVYKVVLILNFKTCREKVENKIKEIKGYLNLENYSDLANEALISTLGIRPSIKNIYNMVIKHLDAFLNYFYNKIINISYKNLTIPENIKTDSTNTEDLPPFTSFYDIHKKEYIIPDNLGVKLIEKEITNDIIKTTEYGYNNLEDVRNKIESSKTIRKGGVLSANFFCDLYFADDGKYLYRKLSQIESSKVIETLYNILIRRIVGFIRFYGNTGIGNFLDKEIESILNTNEFGKETIVSILKGLPVLKDIITKSVADKTVDLCYGLTEDKYKICKQHNDNFLGTVFIFDYDTSPSSHLIGAVPEEDCTVGVKGNSPTNGEMSSNTKHTIISIDSDGVGYSTSDASLGHGVNAEYIDVKKYITDPDYSRIGNIFFRKGEMIRIVDEYSLYKPTAVGGLNFDKYHTEYRRNNEMKYYRYTTRQICALGEYVMALEKEFAYNSVPTIPYFQNAEEPNKYNLQMRMYANVKMKHSVKEFVYWTRFLERYNSSTQTTYYGAFEMTDKYSDYYTNKDILDFYEEVGLKDTDTIYQMFILPVLCKKYYHIDNLKKLYTKTANELESYKFFIGINTQEHKCDESDVSKAVTLFKNKFSTITNVNLEIFTETTKEEEKTYYEKLNTSIYYNLKNIYDKWLCGLSYSDFKYGGGLVNNLHCITPLHEDISHSLCDVDKLYYEIDGIIKGEKKGVSVLNFLSNIAQGNNMLFLTQPSNSNIEFKDYFKPQTLPSVSENVFPQFYFISQGQISHNLNIENSEYDDDGLYYYDINNKTINNELYNYYNIENNNINVFGVSYGIQNQNFFKRVSINTSNSMETEESIANLFNISQKGGETADNKTIVNASSLYPIYGKRSYTSTIEMMGCMNIMPLTYFQINNIPLFNGAYMIVKVSHDITPNDFSTTITGVRVSKFKPPVDSRIFNLPAIDLLSNRLINKDYDKDKYMDHTKRSKPNSGIYIDTHTNEKNLDPKGIYWLAFNSVEGAIEKHGCCNFDESVAGYDDCWRTGVGIMLNYLKENKSMDYYDVKIEYTYKEKITWDSSKYPVGNRYNIIKLLYEKDGYLYYDESGDSGLYGDENRILSKYSEATYQIQKHIDKGYPIMVGVNHTLGKTINEGTTDHFIVIYAYWTTADGKEYYRYYESRNDITNGVVGSNNYTNTLIYEVVDDKPLLYNPNPNSTSHHRYDVTQVRPYIGDNIDFLTTQDSEGIGETVLPR